MTSTMPTTESLISLFASSLGEPRERLAELAAGVADMRGLPSDAAKPINMRQSATLLLAWLCGSPEAAFEVHAFRPLGTIYAAAIPGWNCVDPLSEGYRALGNLTFLDHIERLIGNRRLRAWSPNKVEQPLRLGASTEADYPLAFIEFNVVGSPVTIAVGFRPVPLALSECPQLRRAMGTARTLPMTFLEDLAATFGPLDPEQEAA